MARSELRALTGWHYEALRLFLLGFKTKDITIAVNCAQPTLRNLLRSRVAKEALEAMHARNLDTLSQVHSEIQALCPMALDEMRNELKSEDEHIRHQAARWILESGGSTPVRRVEIRKTSVVENDYDNMSVEELRALAEQRIRQSAIETTATKMLPEPDPDLPVQ